MAKETVTFESSSFIGVPLLAILLNAFLFGVISQQLFSYCISGFKDLRHIKIFVITQFAVVAVQSTVIWNMAWVIFVLEHDRTSNLKASIWQPPVSSFCQCILVLLANLFFASRIHRLTKSRLQSYLVITFSTLAFISGMATILMTWNWKKSPIESIRLTPPRKAMSVVWHGLQAISESLITLFLCRALLKARSGLHKSDRIVKCLVRSVIQVGFFATLWAVAGLGTCLLVPRSTVYTVFEMTVGPIYTHMIYDTLLSRTRLCEHMAEPSQLEMGFPAITMEVWYLT
ncbi:hypothetical protein B0F90DRAFT_1224573 [Multifurca ochricompacta]|uniref:DUF6534 domain-containing protein n=1 Tax=Multifurca ochricompacta TaxID=376703 RepID=A0AAD4M0A1_9AGAM|nr:hypothetical protein B0F90DRAFT_1224573 [Multifurca ochricompacta]